jgi:hypothetical protein
LPGEHRETSGRLRLAVVRSRPPTPALYGEASKTALAKAIADIANTEVEDDGLQFDLDTLDVEEIRENQDYGGLRVSMNVMLERARIPLQIDVGYGDAVVPATIELEYPTLLGGSTPRVRAYPIETVVAEKVEPIVKLGMTNSRMKDYFDLWLIAGSFTFDGRVLTKAFAATFERRGTALPTDDPVGMTREFAEAPDNVKRWHAFLNTSGIEDGPKTLQETVDAIRAFVLPSLHAAVRRGAFKQEWAPEACWT